MAQPGTDTNPLRVAIIGAGPSAFYVAEHLLQQPRLTVDIDFIERLPTPYGLVSEEVVAEQFNPPREIRFQTGDIETIHLVLRMADLYGY